MLRITTSLTLALAFLLVAAPGRDALAQTRTEVVRWQGNNPANTDGYRIHTGSSSRSYNDSIDVGIPDLIDGAYEFAIAVGADDDVYIAVSAYNAQGISGFSNENCKGPLGACGASSEPPPPGVQSQIVGFKLWNASNNTLIDSSFVSGDQIDADAYPCVAIEIVGNAYLSDSGPGSVRKSLNGVNANTCATPGVDHENHAPYAWEADSGPNSFECAASLGVAGTHTLTVTPFDGDGCSGAEGAPVSIQFDVIQPSADPPPAESGPGQPGRPYLVF